MLHSAIAANHEPACPHGPPGRNLDAIVREHSSLISRIAWQVHSRMASGIEVADLIQIGMVALLEGAENFEDRGIALAPYAAMRVRGAMIDELRRVATISRLGMRNKKRINAARSGLTLTLGREPTPPEIAAQIGIDVQEYYAMETSATSITREPIDDSYSDQNMWFADLGSDPYNDLEKADTARKLAASIALLPRQQALALQLYFVEEMNLEEVGEVLGVGAARVCQIKKEAIGALKKHWQEQ